jgi:hypothetical protein
MMYQEKSGNPGVNCKKLLGVIFTRCGLRSEFRSTFANRCDSDDTTTTFFMVDLDSAGLSRCVR